MGNTITFVKDSTTVTLPVSASGSRSTPNVPAGTLQTGDGLYGYQLGAKWYEIRLRFTRLTGAQVAALQSFFDTTVAGITQEFTYTDAEGDAHTVRFLSSPAFNVIATEGVQATVRLRSSDRYR
jgi:hypothetical protein